jgi:hypothetical protein
MKRIWVILLLLACFTLTASAQYARRIVPQPSLPAACLPGNGDVVYLTTGALGLYQCVSSGQWRAVGFSGPSQVLTSVQGSITTSNPFIAHTATWTAAGVTYTNILSTVTDTASAAGSMLMDLRVGANSIFLVGKAGTVEAAASGSFGFAGRSRIGSSANGLITMTNQASADLIGINLGTSAVTHPRIAVSAAVAGQTQGIIILKGDGAAAVFANLGAATNGSMIYCSDCTVASPCAGAGNGAIAKRLNGAWVCN